VARVIKIRPPKEVIDYFCLAAYYFHELFVHFCGCINLSTTETQMFKTNEYFGGKVKSIAFKTNQSPATVGVIAPGEYEFGTSTVEIMTVITGKLFALLPENKKWHYFGPGRSFTVEANEKFKVKTSEDTSYLCLYK
jgi:uncharacterized protein YaiE (UPF0345 family)